MKGVDSGRTSIGCSNEATANIKRFPPQKDDYSRRFARHSIDWVFKYEHFRSPANGRVNFLKKKWREK